MFSMMILWFGRLKYLYIAEQDYGILFQEYREAEFFLNNPEN